MVDIMTCPCHPRAAFLARIAFSACTHGGVERRELAHHALVLVL